MDVFKGGAFVALLVLLHYVKRTQGWRATVVLVLYLTIMATVREWTVVHLSLATNHPPPYAANPSLGHLAGVNVVVVVGWVFTTILSFCLAQMIQRRQFPDTSLFLTLVLTALVTTTISYAVEITGMRMNLWTWKTPDPVAWLPFDWPFDAFEGWASTSFLFMLGYCAVRYRLLARNAWVSAAVAFALAAFTALADLAQPLLGPASPRKKVMVVYMIAAVFLGFRSPGTQETGSHPPTARARWK